MLLLSIIHVPFNVSRVPLKRSYGEAKDTLMFIFIEEDHDGKKKNNKKKAEKRLAMNLNRNLCLVSREIKRVKK